MRIACVGYRDWALEIYRRLASDSSHQFLIFQSRAQYDEQALRDFKPNLVLFYGWSWRVPESLLRDFSCIMLHPSPLPRYRGGSPLQNQIIAGEVSGAVTLFLMDQGLDSGPILARQELSLEGGIDEILQRVTRIGHELTLRLLNDGLKPVPQDESDATVFRRRTPAESELTIRELAEKPARYLFDKIRMLKPPYPSAFIKTADGKRLLILDASIVDDDSSSS